MRKIMSILLLVSLLTLIISGCSKTSDVTESDGYEDKGSNMDDTVEVGQTGTSEEVSGDISDLDDLDDELDISDLDDLESELDFIDW